MKNSPRFELVLPVEERISLLLEEYAHFTREPDALKAKLGPLCHRLGHDRVEAWFDLIDQADWRTFVAALLEQHYDAAYQTAASRRSGGIIGQVSVDLLSQLTSPAIIHEVDRLRREAHVPQNPSHLSPLELHRT